MFYKIFRTIKKIMEGIFYEPQKIRFQHPLLKYDETDNVYKKNYIYNQNYLCTLCKNYINQYYIGNININSVNICHKCKYILKMEN
jgi:hypothetical protein